MTDLAAALDVIVDRPDLGFRLGRLGADYLADWRGVLSLLADANGGVKAITPAPGASPDAIEKVRRGAALAFLRAIAGKHSLHASAAARDGSALVCVGPSGAGKSTMVASLCVTGEMELLADDVVAIDRLDGSWCVEPSESRVWITDGVKRDPKAAVRVRTACSPARLRWVVLLRFDDGLTGPELRSVQGARVGAALLEATVRFELVPKSLRAELDLVGSIASRTLAFELVRPRHAPVPDVARLLNKMMGAGK
jgi:hypothetical protein